MSRPVLIILCVAVISAHAQPQFEQKAVDHFFSNQFRTDYPDVKAIQFRGKTDTSLTEFSFFKNCFEDDNIGKALYQKAQGQSRAPKDITVSAPGVQFTTKPVKSRFRLHILQANVVNDKAYVMVEITKHRHHTNVYFFELDQSGNVIRSCKSGVMH